MLEPYGLLDDFRRESVALERFDCAMGGILPDWGLACQHP